MDLEQDKVVRYALCALLAVSLFLAVVRSDKPSERTPAQSTSQTQKSSEVPKNSGQ